MAYQATVKFNASNRTDAEKTEAVLQNIAANTDKKSIDFLYKKIQENPLFFKQVAKKIQNPVLQKML